MPSLRLSPAAPTLAFLVWHFISAAAPAQEPPRYAGPTDQGFLLPNGWTLKPAGRPIPLADLPLNIVALPDNRHALAATSGYNAHELALIDLQEGKVVDRQAVSQSWFGLAATAQGDRIWWSGGGANVLHTFHLKDRGLARSGGSGANPEDPERKREPRHFRAGIALDAARQPLLFASTSTLEPSRPSISPISRNSSPHRPAAARMTSHSVAAATNSSSPTGPAGWSSSSIPPTSAPSPGSPSASIPTRSPSIPDDDRLFVACASSNCVSVIDTRRGIVTETIYTALFPRRPKAARPTPWPSHPTARRSSSPTPTTTASP